jgi:hypothetical protein
MNQKITPLPWEVSRGNITLRATIQTANYVHQAQGTRYKLQVASVTAETGRPQYVDEMHANAEFIARACNTHDELVTALEGLLNYMDFTRVMDAEPHFKAAHEALAKANKLPERKLVTLTPEQDKAWTKAFEFYANGGQTDEEADQSAWYDIRHEFPMLSNYDGIQPQPKP